ncbi:hypothetical protein Adeg_0762 [Ammonifex degensii KC4]|uniref:Putative Flp pilus-assembly TadG-like N-terminal domain-containing protein n=1 Tax=Ammonifex degensii (strain DSM 10501 / KC4) TaxID=429009 RepID=C9RCD0_AMMDK|nr:pilus assembly protein TadG-related protein [Ammonifex degensii]ACX51907.1 hypothetical protein Adeg_0762 [Ammonifex degensii KC4]
MPRLLSAGGTSLTAPLRDERGAVLVLMSALCVVLALLFVGLSEFGRWLIAREQAQVAADAAAHAAVLSGGERMVKLRIYREPGAMYETCCPCEDGCCTCCEDCGDYEIVVTGTAKHLLDEGGWYTDYYGEVCGPCDCGCSMNYEILDHWVRFDAPVGEAAAEAYFQANYPEQAYLAGKRPVKFYDRTSPYGPSAVVYAWYRVKSLFPRLFGVFPDDYGGVVCAQADAFYRDYEGDRYISDKYKRRAPECACWKDGAY